MCVRVLRLCDSDSDCGHCRAEASCLRACWVCCGGLGRSCYLCVCMYVYMYVYMYIHIYIGGVSVTCVYVCMYVCIYVYACL